MNLFVFYQDLDLHVFVKKMEEPVQKEDASWDYIELIDENQLESILNQDLAIYFEFSDYNYHKAEFMGHWIYLMAINIM